MSTNISLVIPAHNEESRLENTVEKANEELQYFSEGNFEIIIVEDGCSDDTAQIAEELEQEKDNVVHLHFSKRKGRGKALEEAFRISEGEILAFMDADLSTNPMYLKDLIKEIVEENYQIVTGSRLIESSKVERSNTRNIASHSYNKFLSFLFNSDIPDTQCGFKAFERSVVLSLLDKIRSKHWFWTTELHIRAYENSYRVKEIPIEWIEKGDSSVNLVRDTIAMGSKSVLLFLKLKREKVLTSLIE